jgi:polysaccharide deacetylase family protein (PEP-CTERM system associated)
MFNLLTIDLEDYFQVHAFSRVIRYEDWDNYECRIERNTDRLLKILNDATHNSKLNIQNSKFGHLVTHSLNNSLTQKVQATFFVLGWIAERYPGLVRRIQKEGHEIACHGYAHQLVYTQSRDEFRQDIKRAKSILEDITGSEVIGYRAPSYSITNKLQWAFEVLVEEGFKYDSSIFPIRHDFYGIPNAPRFPFVISLNENNSFEFSMLNCEFNTAQNSGLKPQSSVLEVNSLTHSLINPSSDDSEPQHSTTAALNNSLTHSLIHSKLITQNSTFIIEFPISTVKVFGQNFPISGGGYFRLFPYSVIRKGLKSINQKENKPFIFYVHPWEFDADQPRINSLSFRSKFRHYVNLKKTESRFRKLLEDFQFSTIRESLIQNS